MKTKCLNKESVHLSVEDFALFYLDYATSREKKKKKRKHRCDSVYTEFSYLIFYTFQISLGK